MVTVNALSEIAALMGDPARAAMLSLLMDGRAHTASELALAAGVTPQTASGHLGRLLEANLLAARAQGRNRFYRLASGDVAHAMESLMALAGTQAPPASKHAAWRRDPDLRFCRSCYDHLAGQVGLAVTDSLTQHGHLEPEGQHDWQLTQSGELFCQRLGIDVEGAKAAHSRHFARQCLDWSERRPHISGALGAAIADTFFKRGWAQRMRRGRTVRLTDSGRRALNSHFGASL
ncbi:transcriptional regulator, ArsR family [Enhydrobacter aerosaccus]|uniref:Transcriptional regulator, ArsR family n=1 Tax=Enhydrobacter aerosaccus TaxID=225324 RepID=A0A1T4SVH0_9HYPH|nr:helix-turn-helix transcriptional regulator [Enhydrobacter aerosaccus]SKA31891.1 transcriptional regulator, ArsR family [Enhydrobacter aerosaccus]